MANRLLLQTLVKFRDEIKSGSAKFQDVITDYFNSTGKQPTADERTIILNEFNEFAPSNIEDLSVIRTEKLRTSPDSQTPFTDKLRQQNPDVELRGDETFGELTEKLGKPKDQGLGSLYPKGGMSEEIKRDDLAGFMREMRKAGIKNEDVMDVAKITDVAEGKRAATTLARAADMGADTKIKQEFLSDLDEKVMNNGPRYFQEEFQGYDSYGELIQNESSRIRNAVVDDLEELGVDEEKVSNILTYANDVAKKNPYQPEAFIESIKQELEMNNIKYDMSFWENYISKILELSSKAEPRFAGGGLV